MGMCFTCVGVRGFSNRVRRCDSSIGPHSRKYLRKSLEWVSLRKVMVVANRIGVSIPRFSLLTDLSFHHRSVSLAS